MRHPSRIRKPAPPLVTWFWGLFFGLCLTIAFLKMAVDAKLPPSSAFVAFNDARIEALAAGQTVPDRLRIVLLGNSRLKYGTEVDPEGFSFSDDARFEVLRLVNNWATFEDFAPMADRILDLRPDMIVMQTDLLGRGRREWGRVFMYREYLNWRAFGHGPWNPGKIDHQEVQYATPCLNDQSQDRYDWRVDVDSNWLIFDLESDGARNARGFIDKAADQGIRVVLLSMPITERVQSVLTPMDNLASDLLGELERDDKVTKLTFPETVPNERFCDFVHMNEAGRATFTPWLAQQLSDLAGNDVSSTAR